MGMNCWIVGGKIERRKLEGCRNISEIECKEKTIEDEGLLLFRTCDGEIIYEEQ